MDEPADSSCKQWTRLVRKARFFPLFAGGQRVVWTEDGLTVRRARRWVLTVLVGGALLAFLVVAATLWGVDSWLLSLVCFALCGVAIVGGLWAGLRRPARISWGRGGDDLTFGAGRSDGADGLCLARAALDVHVHESGGSWPFTMRPRGWSIVELHHRDCPGPCFLAAARERREAAPLVEALAAVTASEQARQGHTPARTPMHSGFTFPHLIRCRWRDGDSFRCAPALPVRVLRALALCVVLVATLGPVGLALLPGKPAAPWIAIPLTTLISGVGLLSFLVLAAWPLRRRIELDRPGDRLVVRGPGERINVSLRRVAAVQLLRYAGIHAEANLVLSDPPGMRVHVKADRSAERLADVARRMAEVLGVPLRAGDNEGGRDTGVNGAGIGSDVD